MEYVYWLFPITFTLMSLRTLQVNYIRYILKQEIADVDKIEAEDYEELARDSQYVADNLQSAAEKEDAPNDRPNPAL